MFVVVRKGDDILLLRRAATGWMDGHLSLPAGGLEASETMLDAAVRELREETGLLATTDDLQLIHLLHCRSGKGGDEWLGAFFLAERWRGSPVLGEPHKHDQLSWHALDRLPASLIPYVRQGLDLGLRKIVHSSFGW